MSVNIFALRPFFLTSFMQACFLPAFGLLFFLAGCQSPIIDGELSGTLSAAPPVTEGYQNNVRSLTKVIEHDPTDPSAYNMRGTAYGEAKAYDKAIADFSKAVTLDPSYFQAYTNRALAYVRTKQLDQAREDFDQSLVLNPEYPIAYFGRAMLFRSLKKDALALADLNKTIEFASDHAGAFFNRGEIYLSRGENNLALADFNSAIDLEPNSAAPYYGRGLSRIALDNYKEAYDDFYVAARHKKGFYQAWTYRGIVAEKQNAPTEAARAYERALSINPHYKPALEGLERVKKAQS